MFRLAVFLLVLVGVVTCTPNPTKSPSKSPTKRPTDSPTHTTANPTKAPSISKSNTECDADCKNTHQYIIDTKKAIVIQGVEAGDLIFEENTSNDFKIEAGAGYSVTREEYYGSNEYLYHVEISGGGTPVADNQAWVFRPKRSRADDQPWPQTGMVKVNGAPCVKVTDGGIYSNIASVCEVNAITDSTIAQPPIKVKYPKNYELMKTTRHDTALGTATMLGNGMNNVEYTAWSEACTKAGGQIAAATTTSKFCPPIKTVTRPARAAPIG